MNITIFIGHASGLDDYWNGAHDDYITNLKAEKEMLKSDKSSTNFRKRVRLNDSLDSCCKCLKGGFCIGDSRDDVSLRSNPNANHLDAEQKSNGKLTDTKGTATGNSLLQSFATNSPTLTFNSDQQKLEDFFKNNPKITKEDILDWSKNFHNLMKSPPGRTLLNIFCESEFSSENIKFYNAIISFLNNLNLGNFSSTKHYVSRLKALYDDFISDDSPNQVSLTYGMQKNLGEILENYHVLDSELNSRNNSTCSKKNGLDEIINIDPRMSKESKISKNSIRTSTTTSLSPNTTRLPSVTSYDGRKPSLANSHIHEDTLKLLETIKDYVYNQMHRDSFVRFQSSPMLGSIKQRFGV